MEKQIVSKKLTVRCQGDAGSSHDALKGPKAEDESLRHGEDRYVKKLNNGKSREAGRAKKKFAWNSFIIST